MVHGTSAGIKYYLCEVYDLLYQEARGTACGEAFMLAEFRAFFGVRSGHVVYASEWASDFVSV